MKKEFIRDYATDALRYWAKEGKPSYEEAVERIRKKAIRRAGDVDPQKALAFADAELEKRSSALADIMACAELWRVLRENGRGYICDAVEAVYFAEPYRALRRGEITGRVRRFATEAYVGETTVYNWLADARRLFAVMRGMRIDEDEL